MDRERRLKTLRTLVHEMGWLDTMMDVGCLLAEQSYKTDGSQSSSLSTCSKVIHSLRHAWKDCGTFKYPSDMVDVEP